MHVQRNGFRRLSAVLLVVVAEVALLMANVQPASAQVYTFTQNNGVQITPGTAGPLLPQCDDCVAPVTLPFPFQLYGSVFTTANVSSNGNLQFTGSNASFGNGCLPDSGFSNTIFAYWDDLRTDAAGSGIFTSVQGTSPNRIFTIEWRATYYSSGASLQFEIRLHESPAPPNPGLFEIVYGPSAENGASATVGVQGPTPVDVTQFSCNTASLNNQLQLTFQAQGDLQPLKVCKVAGPGVAVGTLFTFTAGGVTFTVPAGPAPGGTCVVAGSFPEGSAVTIHENIPSGDTVTGIGVDPPGQVLGSGPDLSTGTVTVMIGAGVTEVTFTNKRTGFLEICKRSHGNPPVTGNFTFYVNPGNLGPFVVPVGGCTPAIELPAGDVVISEPLQSGSQLVACSTFPSASQVDCVLASQSSTVTINPGSASLQTIAYMDNQSTNTTEPVTTTTSVVCSPSPATLGAPVTCTATVAPASSRTVPTGTVNFSVDGVSVATKRLTRKGSATFLTSTLPAGSHTIVATYSGDHAFAPSKSAPQTLRVRR